MSKKETEEIELVQVELDDLEFLAKASRKKNKKKKVKIQTVEEYFIELGFSPEMLPRKLHKDYPDLFGIKLDKKTKDDVLSETPGVESTPGLQLYASMLLSIGNKKRA